jgi:NAD(P)-dependent dehydrogenase (short-subunit alcohol dehydrogenase family)
VTGYGYNLREELIGTGARVTLIEPGMVDTPFFDEPKPQSLEGGRCGARCHVRRLPAGPRGCLRDPDPADAASGALKAEGRL